MQYFQKIYKGILVFQEQLKENELQTRKSMTVNREGTTVTDKEFYKEYFYKT